MILKFQLKEWKNKKKKKRIKQNKIYILLKLLLFVIFIIFINLIIIFNFFSSFSFFFIHLRLRLRVAVFLITRIFFLLKIVFFFLSLFFLDERFARLTFQTLTLRFNIDRIRNRVVVRIFLIDDVDRSKSTTFNIISEIKRWYLKCFLMIYSTSQNVSKFFDHSKSLLRQTNDANSFICSL